MEQLYLMDRSNINKEEMHHPVKHIIITNKNRPVLLDFERCHHVKSPGNITQFCDFLMSKRIKALLRSKRIKIENKKMIRVAGEYKRNQNNHNLNKIKNNLV